VVVVLVVVEVVVVVQAEQVPLFMRGIPRFEVLEDEASVWLHSCWEWSHTDLLGVEPH